MTTAAGPGSGSRAAGERPVQTVNEQNEKPLSTLRQHWTNGQARGLHLGDEREVEAADDPRDEGWEEAVGVHVEGVRV